MVFYWIVTLQAEFQRDERQLNLISVVNDVTLCNHTICKWQTNRVMEQHYIFRLWARTLADVYLQFIIQL